MSTPQRLPTPYRCEADIVAERLRALHDALDWAAVARVAAPWVQAVRDHPPPFWAMESLLREYPIGSSEGLALMRLAEALLRVPDTETAIALTADQLGRADFDGASEQVLARLSSAAIAMGKHFWLILGFEVITMDEKRIGCNALRHSIVTEGHCHVSYPGVDGR